MRLTKADVGRPRRLRLRRPTPKTPVRGMVTYRVASPLLTHTRPATCAEVECRDHVRGWDSVVPRVGSPSAGGADSITEASIRAAAGGLFDGIVRRFVECRGLGHESCPDDGAAGRVRLHFPPGQTCFWASTHRVGLHRPEFYTVRGGDWRANLGLIRRHTRPEHWVEDFALNQEGVARRVNRG